MSNYPAAARSLLRRGLPNPIVGALRARPTGVRTLIDGATGLSRRQTRELLGRLELVSQNIVCGHSEEELLRVALAVLGTPPQVPGVVVECGSWKGGSAAKLSIVARLVHRQLFVFDSFQGVPENDQGFSRTIHGQAVEFRPGDYKATMQEVTENIRRWGEMSVTTLVPGWFHETLPPFQQPVAVAYLDVDLASSTMTCIEHLWPRLSPGGMIFSQDGHITAVIDALEDHNWWRHKLRCTKVPHIYGAGTHKLVYIAK